MDKHVDEEVDNAGVEEDGCDEAPPLVRVGGLIRRSAVSADLGNGAEICWWIGGVGRACIGD